MEQGQHPKGFLAALLFLLAAGIYVSASCAPPVEVLALVFCVLFLSAVILSWRSSKWAFLPCLLLFFVLGLLRGAGSCDLPANDISALAGRDVEIAGILREEPRTRLGSEGEEKTRCRVAVTEVRLPGGAWQAASGEVYLYAQGAAAEARIGDEIHASGKVRLMHGYQNPGQVATEQMLRADGITASLVAGKAEIKAEPREAGLWDSVLRASAAVRAHYRESLANSMADADAAAIFAMLFGGYDGLRDTLVDSFVSTGIVHILSVSGSHVSLLAAAVACLGALFRLPRLLTAWLVVLAIVFYCILAGGVPPAIRAGLMGGLSFFAIALGREREGAYLFLLTALCLLLASPLLLFHISFQLSIAATGGLVFLAPVFRRRLLAWRVPRFPAAVFSLTLAAQLATLPLLAWYFGRVSLSAFLANLLLVPPLEGIIVLALFGGALALVLPSAGAVLLAALALLLGAAYEGAKALAAIRMVSVPAMGGVATACYYALLGCFLLGEDARARVFAVLVAHRRSGLLLVCAVLVFALAARFTSPREMEVHFIDVHQGDAALIRTPNGHAFLIDTGGTRDGAYDVGARVDLPYLRHFGVQRLDAIFLSHAHEDHAAGAGSILRALPVRHVCTSSEGREVYAKSMGLSVASPLLDKMTVLRTGERFVLDGVTVEVLAAPEAASRESGNEACDVLRVRYGDVSFLFTGDMGVEEERALLAAGISPESTVLKVAHHGSASSTSEAFLSATSPSLAVISVGADNSYGHPAPAVMKRLQEKGIPVLRTDEEGAILLTTDGKKLYAETYVNGRIR